MARIASRTLVGTTNSLPVGMIVSACQSRPRSLTPRAPFSNVVLCQDSLPPHRQRRQQHDGVAEQQPASEHAGGIDADVAALSVLRWSLAVCPPLSARGS